MAARGGDENLPAGSLVHGFGKANYSIQGACSTVRPCLSDGISFFDFLLD